MIGRVSFKWRQRKGISSLARWVQAALDTPFELLSDPQGPDPQRVQWDTEPRGEPLPVLDLHAGLPLVVLTDELPIPRGESLQALLQTLELLLCPIPLGMPFTETAGVIGDDLDRRDA